jgi:hypothetical protein
MILSRHGFYIKSATPISSERLNPRMRSEDEQADLWEIYRLELVFLNPEEYRWQLFQYWPGASASEEEKSAVRRAEAVYRLQAQSLLEWVHESTTSRHFAEPESEERVQIDVAAIRRDMLARMGDNLNADDRKHLLCNFIDRYCKHASEIVDAEGLPKDTVDWISDIKTENPQVRYLDRSEAADVTSTLFVAHDWDLYGRISFPEKNIRDEISASALKSFDYCISYPDGVRDNLLGYPIDLVCSLQWDDYRNVSPESPSSKNPLKSLVECKDYFQHCNPISSVEQKLWYCMYGLIIDQINKYGAHRDALYARCFPLRICGYDHFLQILVRNRNGSAAVGSLPAVFNKGLETIVLKECLRELMVPMHITAFQRHAAKRFDNDFSDEAQPKNYLHHLFALHAPNLVKMDGLWVDQEYYSYAPSPALAGFRRWRRMDPSNDGWQKRPSRSSIGHGHYVYVDPEGLIVVQVPWERRFGKLSPLLSGTGKQRLREQWHWLNDYAKRKRFTGHLMQLTRTFENPED